MDGERLKKVVIVGGGTAGWMTAAALIAAFPNSLEITLIESTQIGNVGVGEATVPAIRDFIRQIGLSEIDVMREVGGTVKLGIRFDGWSSPKSSFFHPFSYFGMDAGSASFMDIVTRLRQAGEEVSIFDYSFPIALMRENRFAFPSKQTEARLFEYDWAMHFDANKFSGLLRKHACGSGVKRIDGKIVDVGRCNASGDVSRVVLEDGLSVGGDLFIDCSGFKSLLLGQTLEVPYESYSNLLFCNRAVAVGSRYLRGEAHVPYTVSAAHSYGWKWRIPLRHRVGNGLLYNSDLMSQDEAISMLVDGVDGEVLGEPLCIGFDPGRRKKIWKRNVIGIGLSAGFLEPLESTSISLIQTSIDRLIRCFPDNASDEVLAAEFNRTTVLEYERLRDFILAHYVFNGRKGEVFWDECRSISLPETLTHKVEMFRKCGRVVNYDWETFYEPSWQAVLVGLGVSPEGYHRFADEYSVEELKIALSRMKEAIRKKMLGSGSYSDYIGRVYN